MTIGRISAVGTRYSNRIASGSAPNRSPIWRYAERDRRETLALSELPRVAATPAAAVVNSAIDRDCREKVLMALRDSLEAMEAESRQAVLHHYVDGLTNQDAAKLMGVVPGTATRRRDRGLSQLRDLLHARIAKQGDSLKGCLEHMLHLGDGLDISQLLLAMPTPSSRRDDAEEAPNAKLPSAKSPSTNLPSAEPPSAKSSEQRPAGGRP